MVQSKLKKSTCLDILNSGCLSVSHYVHLVNHSLLNLTIRLYSSTGFYLLIKKDLGLESWLSNQEH